MIDMYLLHSLSYASEWKYGAINMIGRWQLKFNACNANHSEGITTEPANHWTTSVLFVSFGLNMLWVRTACDWVRTAKRLSRSNICSHEWPRNVTWWPQDYWFGKGLLIVVGQPAVNHPHNLTTFCPTTGEKSRIRVSDGSTDGLLWGLVERSYTGRVLSEASSMGMVWWMPLVGLSVDSSSLTVDVASLMFSTGGL